MKKNKRLLKTARLGILVCITLFICTPGLAEIYKYKNEDGVWIFTDNPGELPDQGVNVMDGTATETSPTAPGVDLVSRLRTAMKPANEIETAALSVVAIESPIGSGTGFFVTDTGFLFTNRHVLQLTAQEQDLRETSRSQTEEKIKTARKKLNLEQEKLELFKRQLDDYAAQIPDILRQQDREYARENHAIETERYRTWLAEHKKRKKQFKKEVSEYRAQVSMEDYNANLSALQRKFTLTLADRSQVTARLVTFSTRYDLALLKLDGYRTPYLKPAGRKLIFQGQKAYAIGNPINLRHSVSQGIMSGLDGIFVKTDAKIYPGNSGGPLVTPEGQVMGINTFKELTRNYEGLGFAIAMDIAVAEFRSYLTGGNR